MSALTAPVNRIVRDEHISKSNFEDAIGQIGNTTSFAQGDLLVFDTTTHKLKLPALEADGSTFVGISRITIVNGKILSPYQGTAVDGAQAIVDIPGPIYSCVAKLLLKAGDTIQSGANVFLDPTTGTYCVQAAGTKSIGIYVGSGPLTAGANGTFIEVRLGNRYPNDTLTF